MLTTDGSLPQQLGVVWSRLLEADSEGPSFISHAACARSVSSSRTFLSCACGALSTAQWRRTITARLLAGRLSEGMKSRVSRSIVRPISRMLSTMTTPFKPGQSWRSCNQETSCRTVVVRVSMRPCVNGHDGAFDRHQVEQLRTSDDLVGFLGHLDLPEHEALARR